MTFKNTVFDTAYINSCFEMKKLDLNEDKCHKMHVGKQDKYCPDTHVHGKVVNSVAKVVKSCEK